MCQLLNFYKTHNLVRLIFILTLLIIFFPKKTYACADVDGATVTYTSDCRQIVVTGYCQ